MDCGKWKTVLWSDESKFEVLFGKLGRHVIWLKRTRTTQVVISAQFRSLHLWWYGVAWVRVAWAAYTSGKAPSMLKGYPSSRTTYAPSRRRLFQGRPCIFQHDNARPHTASITTSWLRRRRIRVLKWPACSPDFSPIENIWRIIKRKMRQRRPKTVEQLEACIRQEWDNIPIPKLEQLVSSVPRRLQTVIKRRGDATQW